MLSWDNDLPLCPLCPLQTQVLKPVLDAIEPRGAWGLFMGCQFPGNDGLSISLQEEYANPQTQVHRLADTQMAAMAPLPLITVRTTYSTLFSRRAGPLGQPSLADYLRYPCCQLRAHYVPGTVIYTHFAL